MLLTELKRKYLDHIDSSIMGLQSILQDIENVADFGWEGRKQISMAASQLHQAKYWFINKMAYDHEDVDFIKKRSAISRCFSAIDKEIVKVEKLLQNNISNAGN